MRNSKLFGLLVALAVVGLSLGDALTGHGIKGNRNLNPLVAGTRSGTTTGTGNDDEMDASIKFKSLCYRPTNVCYWV